MGYFTTWLQITPATKVIYKKLKKSIHRKDFSVSDINVIKCKKSNNEKIRFNIVLPTVNKYKIFGGIATALKIYESMAKELNSDMRIIVNRQEHYNKKYSLEKEGYSYNTGEGEKQFIFLSDKENQLSVRKNDIFLCTSWDTAYCMEAVIKWKEKNYPEVSSKLLYLIQDYEPGFYAWSSQYLLADSTYKMNDINVIAIFNSKELHDYFINKGYSFSSTYYFMPRLNQKLGECLNKSKLDRSREKIILIYGRPNTERNAFAIIVHALRLWAETYENASEWKILSLGETFEDIKVSETMSISSKGKVTLEEYANTMLQAYVGISLMVSPHPSYPPLEMSTFGVKTLTNNFENKNLSHFNKNIETLDRCTPEAICEWLKKNCDEYPNKITEIDLNNDYVKEENMMKKMIEDIAGELN